MHSTCMRCVERLLITDQCRPLCCMMQINKVKDFNARDDASIRHLIHRSNLVINLIGIQKETMNWSFEETHIDTAARIAEAVKDNDMVERFWHVSCLGASEQSESRRLRSKVNWFHLLACCA